MTVVQEQLVAAVEAGLRKLVVNVAMAALAARWGIRLTGFRLRTARMQVSAVAAVLAAA